MLLNSVPFVVLLAITFASYYAPFMRARQILVLIAASFVFYSYQHPKLLVHLSQPEANCLSEALVRQVRQISQ